MKPPAPVAIGILDDTPDGVDRALFERAFALAFRRLAAAGRFDRSFELLFERVEGLPWGTARAVVDAHASLVERGALAVVGPAIGDNALVAVDPAERARVPTLNWAGTEEARSEYSFHFQVGSHEEEPLLLARELRARGRSRVALLFERSIIGSRYTAFFDDAVFEEGLELVARRGVVPGAPDLAPAVEPLLRAEPDALVYLGLGGDLPALRKALDAVGLECPALCNSCGMFGWVSDERRRALEGFAYVDVVSEQNPVLVEALAALEVPFETGPLVACYRDMAELVAQGLARAPELTHRGLRDGLERIKTLPAALGHAGTVMGFGHCERSALKGPYLVLRRWRGGRSLPAG